MKKLYKIAKSINTPCPCNLLKTSMEWNFWNGPQPWALIWIVKMSWDRTKKGRGALPEMWGRQVCRTKFARNHIIELRIFSRRMLRNSPETLAIFCCGSEEIQLKFPQDLGRAWTKESALCDTVHFQIPEFQSGISNRGCLEETESDVVNAFIGLLLMCIWPSGWGKILCRLGTG